jgi:lysyl-tRNA synthetase class 2
VPLSEIGEQLMSETATWQPSASIPNLLKRAAIMAEIRRFFADRGVLEVETPCMSQATVTDIHLVPFETRFVGPGHSQGMNLYLMTSPEYHMKRLLAAGCGPVYQLCRSFRNEEMGRHHNPEFTMLEWYRPHYDMYRLMNEVDDLLQQVLDCSEAETLSYQQAFQRHLEIDPLSADKTQLREVAAKLDLSNVADTEEDRDTLLQLLFTFGVEPQIGKDRPTFVYHFPASQASLAQISTEDHRVAERFEVYYKGIELANGFHELTDAREQQQRFEQDNRKRAARGLPQQPIDVNLLEALKAGLPDCSGVALGVDRLVMLALGAEQLGDVIAFTVDRACRQFTRRPPPPTNFPPGAYAPLTSRSSFYPVHFPDASGTERHINTVLAEARQNQLVDLMAQRHTVSHFGGVDTQLENLDPLL